MTVRELTESLSTYAAGLEAELALLRHVERLGHDQRDATKAVDSTRLQHISEERTRLMTGLVTIEHEISDARQRLAEHQQLASTLPGFADVAALHKIAGALVNRIMAADQETMAALREAELTRREATLALETGETTLNAYRRVLNPSLSGPSLVDQHG